jgi:hypothetical protein
LLPLGVWRGGGEVVYPTIDGPYAFGQQLVFAHDGRPFLSYEARAWLLGPDGEVLRPAARETGFWRPQPDGELEACCWRSMRPRPAVGSPATAAARAPRTDSS